MDLRAVAELRAELEAEREQLQRRMDSLAMMERAKRLETERLREQLITAQNTVRLLRASRDVDILELRRERDRNVGRPDCERKVDTLTKRTRDLGAMYGKCKESLESSYTRTKNLAREVQDLRDALDQMEIRDASQGIVLGSRQETYVAENDSRRMPVMLRDIEQRISALEDMQPP